MKDGVIRSEIGIYRSEKGKARSASFGPLFLWGQTKADRHPKATQSAPIIVLLLDVFKAESVDVLQSPQKN